MGDWKQELEEILEEETDMGRNMIPKYARGYARIILENFISQELSKAGEEAKMEEQNRLKPLLERMSYCPKCGGNMHIVKANDLNWLNEYVCHECKDIYEFKLKQ